MRILIGAGGTGGHIYPAIAIADALRQTHPDSEILFLGAREGMEMTLVSQAGYEIKPLPIQQLFRKKIGSNIKLPFLVGQSCIQAYRYIKAFHPAVVVGTGGYAAFPTLLAAAFRDIPTLIQEQNSVPGIANKLLSCGVDKICTGYAKVSFPCQKEKITCTGNPVRPAIYSSTIDTMGARSYFLGEPSDKKWLLVVGGSGGAGGLNGAILRGIPTLYDMGIQLLWITGKRYFSDIQHQIDAKYRAFIVVMPFVENMAIAYAAADLVISRAGALAIAELSTLAKPTILVPSPYVAGNHQVHNSQPIGDMGGAVIVPENNLNQLIAQAIHLMQDTERQAKLAHQLAIVGELHKNALGCIIKEIEALTQK